MGYGCPLGSGSEATTASVSILTAMTVTAITAKAMIVVVVTAVVTTAEVTTIVVAAKAAAIAVVAAVSRGAEPFPQLMALGAGPEDQPTAVTAPLVEEVVSRPSTRIQVVADAKVVSLAAAVAPAVADTPVAAVAVADIAKQLQQENSVAPRSIK